MDDELKKLLAACNAKAERVSKPVPVVVKGIGKFHVRPRLVPERDQFDQAMKDGNEDGVARAIANLLCREDGTRLTPEERDNFAKVFARLPLNDMGVIGAAADGVDEGN